MAGSDSRVPLAVEDLFRRIGLPGARVPAAEVLQRTRLWKQVLEDYRPVAECLEWRLAALSWKRGGVQPFIASGVPYVVNNSGTLSADAAELLFANCCEADDDAAPIRALELGAGTGLFARYFLDRFEELCRNSGRDFYNRFTYIVTDGSPRTIEQWREFGIFEVHGPHAELRCMDARDATCEPVRAVFCNYVLDVLPMTYLRRTDSGWEELYVRTSIADREDLLRQYTPLTFDELREHVEADDLVPLLPLIPLLECEEEFRTLRGNPPLDIDVPMYAAVAFNYGALDCLCRLLPLLDTHGFLLMNEYGPDGACGGNPRAGDRFGTTVAAGLNFPLIEGQCRRLGFAVSEPDGDATRRLRSRLVSRGGPPRMQEMFEGLFAAERREQSEAPGKAAAAQAECGHHEQALELYREAVARNPYDWNLMANASEFAGSSLGDYETALQLASLAVQRNPWYDPGLWNVLGDCLRGLGRVSEAHECYQQAARIHPSGVHTCLRLAETWLALANPREALSAIASGLAGDSNGMFRHVLLSRQQEALDALSIRWNHERATAERRSH